jgi:2-methylcitrate dehydratase PrpD
MAAQPEVTRALVAHAHAIRYEDIPAGALEVARHCLLDFMGCALAGSREPLSEVLVREVALPEAGTQATLIGRAQRATAQTAALVNGSAGHALDFDDTHAAMGGHPSVPVLPALLAVAEGAGASGRDLLAALVAGFELQARLGRVLGDGHYAAGFHTTGTVGTFGAAAACAHLLGLDETGWCHALGLAGTQAAGLKSGFGTMAKPLHAGRAAAAGLLSARLARGGFTAHPAIVETAQGFAVTHAGTDPSTAAIERAAGHWYVCDTLFKYHAACYLTHAPIEAIGALRRAHGVDPEKVEHIEIQVNPSLFAVCNIEEPTTGLEGKFSLRATAALALLGIDTEDTATFCAETITDPRVVSIRDRVQVVAGESLTATQARVSIESPAGVLKGHADTGTPAADLAEQGQRLRRKFERLAAPVLGDERARGLADAALAAQELASTAELLALARPA